MGEMTQAPRGAGSYNKPVQSVGEEFVAWAETYYGLEEIYKNYVKDPEGNSGEIVPYHALKRRFAEHINVIIQNRFAHYM